MSAGEAPVPVASTAKRLPPKYLKARTNERARVAFDLQS